MNVTVSLPPELESSLRMIAAAAGKNLAALVLEAVEEKLARDKGATKSGGDLEAGPDPLPYGEWKQRFEAWMADVERRGPRYPVGFVIDDSRSSIYEGRGE